MSEFKETIHVIGPPRCGSTLIYNILCSSRATNDAISETHILPNIAKLYHQTVGRLEIEKGHIFTDESEVRDLFIEFSELFINRLASRYPDAEKLVIKNIRSASWAPILTLLIPNQIFCVCVRDPRDIVASMVDVGKKQEAMGRKNQYPRVIDHLVKIVNSSYMPSLVNTSDQFRKNSFVVEYKSLIEDPRETIAFMEESTGLDLGGFEPAENWKSSKVNIEKLKNEGAPFITEHWGRPITSASLGAYKEKLSPEEIIAIEDACRPLFDLFNFDTHS